MIRAVDETLQAWERTGRLRSPKTRARFRVYASTGRRPSEIMRAEPPDVDLTQCVWRPRDGKGGWGPGIYLNDDMLAAWELFVEANAWGSFRIGSLVRTIRRAGWPAGVRPYNLRHTVGISISEAGGDLADVQAHLGHKHISTTRKHYVPDPEQPYAGSERADQRAYFMDAHGRNAGCRTCQSQAEVESRLRAPFFLACGFDSQALPPLTCSSCPRGTCCPQRSCSLTLSIDLPGIMRLGPQALIMFATGTVSIVLGGPLAILVFSFVSPDTIGGTGPDAIWRGLATVAGSWIGGRAPTKRP